MFRVALIEALQSMLATKLRTILNLLGVVIGVWSVVVMLSIGNGAKKQIHDSVASFGSSLLIVTPETPKSDRKRGGGRGVSSLTLDDVESIRALTGVKTAAPIVSNSAQIVYGAKNRWTSVTGTTPDYFSIYNWRFAKGGMFDERETQSGRLVAVLGSTVAKDLFGKEDPLGQRIRIDSVPFDVIGVLKGKGQSAVGEDQDDAVIIPLATAQRKLFGARFPNNVSVIMAPMISEEWLKRGKVAIEALLRENHDIAKAGEEDFKVQDLKELTEGLERITTIVTIFLGSIASISLLVGGIGIMNMMLVSVTERTREIGVRKAIGAHERQIMLQFLLEAVIVTLGGCSMGVGLGIVTAYIIESINKDVVTAITAGSVLLAFSVCLILGVFFGFYPARKAAKLNPIEALRSQ